MTGEHADLLKLLKGADPLDKDQFKKLVLELDDHGILAKVFLLEGTPHVFEKSPMKYVVFKETVAAKFEVGSQDVRIVGSARLGFSPSPSAHKYGKPFNELSDVDVVIVSERWFTQGSQELFESLNSLRPPLYEVFSKQPEENVAVMVDDWRRVKEAIRNFSFGNFNPGLLPDGNAFKRQIFESLKSTTGLFLALEPQVFVSKIRCRVFRSWKAAEAYYTNSLRELRRALKGEPAEPVEDLEEPGGTKPAGGEPGDGKAATSVSKQGASAAPVTDTDRKPAKQ